MLWRGAIIATIVGLWITAGVAWGPWAALNFGVFLFAACVIAFASIIGGEAIQGFGGWYYARQLRGRHRR